MPNALAFHPLSFFSLLCLSTIKRRIINKDEKNMKINKLLMEVKANEIPFLKIWS